MRVQNYQKENLRRRQKERTTPERAAAEPGSTTRQSGRAAVAQVKDVEELRALLVQRDEQIEALCLLLENRPTN